MRAAALEWNNAGGLRSLDHSRQGEVCRRAPTLMGGEVAGSQGRVQVWSSDSKQRQWKTGAYALPLALSAGLLALQLSPDFWFSLMNWSHLWFYSLLSLLLRNSCLVFVSIFCLCGPALLALARRCYIATDEAGIAITTWHGNKSLRWSEISGCYRGYGPGSMEIYTRSGETVGVNLSGYSREASDNLYAVINTRAHLKPVQGLRLGSSHRSRLQPALMPES